MTTQFQAGQTYNVTTCKGQVVKTCTIIRRTAKTVWFKNKHGEIKRKSVKVNSDNDAEFLLINWYTLCSRNIVIDQADEIIATNKNWGVYV